MVWRGGGGYTFDGPDDFMRNVEQIFETSYTHLESREGGSVIHGYFAPGRLEEGRKRGEKRKEWHEKRWVREEEAEIDKKIEKKVNDQSYNNNEYNNSNNITNNTPSNGNNANTTNSTRREGSDTKLESPRGTRGCRAQ